MLIGPLPGIYADKASLRHLLEEKASRQALETTDFQGLQGPSAQATLLENLHPDRHVGAEPILPEAFPPGKRLHLGNQSRMTLLHERACQLIPDVTQQHADGRAGFD